MGRRRERHGQNGSHVQKKKKQVIGDGNDYEQLSLVGFFEMRRGIQRTEASIPLVSSATSNLEDGVSENRTSIIASPGRHHERRETGRSAGGQRSTPRQTKQTRKTRQSQPKQPNQEKRIGIIGWTGLARWRAQARWEESGSINSKTLRRGGGRRGWETTSWGWSQVCGVRAARDGDRPPPFAPARWDMIQPAVLCCLFYYSLGVWVG